MNQFRMMERFRQLIEESREPEHKRDAGTSKVVQDSMPSLVFHPDAFTLVMAPYSNAELSSSDEEPPHDLVINKTEFN